EAEGDQGGHIMLKLSRRALLVGALAPALPKFSWAPSEEIRVIRSGGFATAMPQRVARGEPTDIIILARSALDEFAARGVVRPESRVDLAESRIGVVVRAGASKPDISTVDALRRTLLNAASIAYSASASGVYVST